jgi:hypothetical protein
VLGLFLSSVQTLLAIGTSGTAQEALLQVMTLILLLNSTAAEVTNTDYIDPLSSGFTVTSSAPAALNASGGTYIFLAIA